MRGWFRIKLAPERGILARKLHPCLVASDCEKKELEDIASWPCLRFTRRIIEGA